MSRHNIGIRIHRYLKRGVKNQFFLMDEMVGQIASSLSPITANEISVHKMHDAAECMNDRCAPRGEDVTTMAT